MVILWWEAELRFEWLLHVCLDQTIFAEKQLKLKAWKLFACCQHEWMNYWNWKKKSKVSWWTIGKWWVQRAVDNTLRSLENHSKVWGDFKQFLFVYLRLINIVWKSFEWLSILDAINRLVYQLLNSLELLEWEKKSLHRTKNRMKNCIQLRLSIEECCREKEGDYRKHNWKHSDANCLWFVDCLSLWESGKLSAFERCSSSQRQ